MSRLLAEMLGNPDVMIRPSRRLSTRIRQARVLVLSDELRDATYHVGALKPSALDELRLGAALPWCPMFLEYRLATLDDLGVPLVCGILVDQDDGGTVSAHCFTSPTKRGGKVMNWPTAFQISVTERAVSLDRETFDVVARSHSFGSVAYAQAVWGYGPNVKPGPLQDKCLCYIADEYAAIVKLAPEIVAESLKEISGVPRHVIAALALLNGPTERVSEPATARRVLIHGASVPARDREVCTISLPKRVREPIRYLVNALRLAAKKRRHEVRGHYRYLKREPRALGWQPVTVAGEPMWRKWIAAHERGSEELGRVRSPRATFIVHR